MHPTIETYNQSQDEYRDICEFLAMTIAQELPDATQKVWHGAPVWFTNDNPVVGYAVRKNGVQLLFWSGQSFNEDTLHAEGSFKAAEIYYRNIKEINEEDLNRWLLKAETIQWDYKNIVKRRGVLERLK